MTRAREEIAVFLLAVQFLTRVPVRSPHLATEARLAAAPRYHPLVGALIGAFSGGVFWLAHLVFPASLSVVLAVAASLVATGALHEDGFADTCDGLGGGATRDRALEIMRDSRLGTYGAAGLGLMLATKVLALAAAPVEAVPWLLIAGHAGSRSSAVLALATGTYVRDAGIAEPVAGAVGRGSLAHRAGDRRGGRLPAARGSAPDRGAGRTRGPGGRPRRDARPVRAQARRVYGGLPRRGAADERARHVPRCRRGAVARGMAPAVEARSAPGGSSRAGRAASCPTASPPGAARGSAGGLPRGVNETAAGAPPAPLDAEPARPQ